MPPLNADKDKWYEDRIRELAAALAKAGTSSGGHQARLDELTRENQQLKDQVAQLQKQTDSLTRFGGAVRRAPPVESTE